MVQKLYRFIPNQVDNRVVVAAFELMRTQQKILRKNYSQHLRSNQAAMKAHLKELEAAGGYIENQLDYTDMAYGESNVAFSGCEVLAAYNAIYAVFRKAHVSLPDMIASFEQDGMVMQGKFGTSPKAIQKFLQSWGLKTRFTTREEDFDYTGRISDALILTVYNDRNDLNQEVHTICISKSGEVYTAHNVYGNGMLVCGCRSVTDVIASINQGKAKGICLIGITKA